MKTRFRLLLLPLSLCVLSACATMDENYAAEPQTQAGYEQDNEYIATVEYLAQRNGVRVIWINPPMDRVASDD